MSELDELYPLDGVVRTKGRHAGWPKYSVELPATGNHRLLWPVPGREKPMPIREVLPREPKEGYATPDEAILAHRRFMLKLREGATRTMTVAGFAELWSDPVRSPWRKQRIGGGDRSEQTLRTLRSKVGRFVTLHGDKRMDQIGASDLKEYLELGEQPDERPIGRSSLGGLSLMWKDAASDEGGRLVTTNPFEKMAARIVEEDKARRGDDEIEAPDEEQINALLDAAYSDPYPIGFARWLEFGQETGMRAGELDAASLDFLSEIVSDGERVVLYHVREQFNDKTKTFTTLKWDRSGKGRQIPLSPRALEIVDECRADAERWGTRRMFLTPDGRHLNGDYRNRYWSGERRIKGLRWHVDGMQMKNATRHYFATSKLAEINRRELAGLGAPSIRLLAEHMGHSEAVLKAHYAKRYARDMQVGMHRLLTEHVADELAPRRRRRAA